MGRGLPAARERRCCAVLDSSRETMGELRSMRDLQGRSGGRVEGTGLGISTGACYMHVRAYACGERKEVLRGSP